MTTVLKDCLLVTCAVYIDDVIIFANSASDCWVQTVRVLALLTAAGFSISPKKCRFCVTQVTMLGHRFGSGFFRPKETKLAACQAFDPPRDLQALQSLHGLLNYFRGYIPKFNVILGPIVKLLGDQDPIWT